MVWIEGKVHLRPYMNQASLWFMLKIRDVEKLLVKAFHTQFGYGACNCPLHE
jgi:hypothetical protein